MKDTQIGWGIGVVVLALLLPVSAPAQATGAAAGNGAAPSTTPAAATAPAEAAAANLRIAAGDLIQVTVFGAPDFDKQVRVSDNGQVMLPLIGAARVGGSTAAEAEDLIAKRLAKDGYFNNPQVSVLIKEYATQGISVLGEVNKPGIYQLLGPHHLLDALSIAGGTTEKAGKTVTITHRDRPNSPEKLPLPNSPGDVGEANVPLRPGDVVYVAKAGMVYVIGDVRQPMGIIAENAGLTVLQAIAMAQGTNATASLNGTKVIRKDSGAEKEIPVPLKRILEAKSPDVPVQPGDIIFVPSSASKSAGRRGLEAILQAATGVAIYRRP